MKLVQTAAEAVSYIGSGQRVFVHGEAATPHLLLGALFERSGSLKDVVTEYGVIDLFGKTLKERAQALITIAHPDDRERLEREWREIMLNGKKQ